MFVLITCPECGKSMKIVETDLGSDATCPACGHAFPTEAEATEAGAQGVLEADVLESEDVGLAEAEPLPHAHDLAPAEHPSHADEEAFHADAAPVEYGDHAHADRADEEVFHADAVPVPIHGEEHEEEVMAEGEPLEADAVAPMEELLHPEDAPSENVLEDYEPTRPALAQRPRRKRSVALLIGIVAAAILAGGGAAVFFGKGDAPADPNARPGARNDKPARPDNDNKQAAADAPPDSLDALKKLGLTVEEKDGKIIAASTNDKFTDATLPHLVKHLGELESLTLQSPISDEGLRHLAGLKNLRRLDFGGELGGKERLNGAGLADLKDLTNLEEIDLNKTGVTDAALMHLQGFANLTVLNLAQTGITDAGLAYLQSLRNLRKLSLADTKITDAGLVYLKKLTKLEDLMLQQTAINGSGLANLRFSNKLKTLDLSETRLSDSSLAHLQAFKSLASVQVRNTQVTKGGVAKLKKALPKVQVD